MKYICGVCNKEVKTVRALAIHYGKYHKESIPTEECKFCKSKNKLKLYEENDIFIWKKEREFSCSNKKCITQTLNPMSKEFLTTVKGLTEEEATLFLNNKNKKGHKSRVINGTDFTGDKNPQSLTYLVKNGLTEEEAKTKLKVKGEKVKQKRYELGYTWADNNNPSSVKYWIDKGLSLNEAKHKIREKNGVCDEFWLKKGFTGEELRKKQLKRSSNTTLISFIEKFGEELGNIKYKIYQETMSSHTKRRMLTDTRFGNLKSSKEAFNTLKYAYKLLRQQGITKRDIFLGTSNKKEFWLKKGKEQYFYDFCCWNLKFIIEYNGTHVHHKPDISIEESLKWVHAFNKKSYDECLLFDKNKIDFAKQHGYDVLVLWSDSSIEENKKLMENFIWKKLEQFNKSL